MCVVERDDLEQGDFHTALRNFLSSEALGKAILGIRSAKLG